MTNMFRASLRARYPFARNPRRIVSDMLPVPALELRNPDKLFILVKAHDFPGNSRRFCRHRFLLRLLRAHRTLL
jgi:hypothetical protein